jgi:hypothetical protein
LITRADAGEHSCFGSVVNQLAGRVGGSLTEFGQRIDPKRCPPTDVALPPFLFTRECKGRSAFQNYLETLDVIDEMTSDALLNAASRSVMPWRRAM